MKSTILTLVAFLLFGTASAFAQFSSSPMEPGLKDHLRHNNGTPVQFVNEKKMVIDGVSTDWVSQNQVTLSAVVIARSSRERVAPDRRRTAVRAV